MVAGITDDDAAPQVTLNVANSPIAEAGGVAMVTATLSHVTYQSVTVALAFSGSASAGDYSASSQSITISPGAAAGSISLTATNDPDDEPDETIVVDISSVTNGFESGTQQVAASITDDDVTPAQMIAALGGQIDSYLAGGQIQSAGAANSLKGKLDAANSALARGNANAAANQVRAFIQEVQAQRGKKLSTAAADALIAAAQAFLAAL